MQKDCSARGTHVSCGVGRSGVCGSGNGTRPLLARITRFRSAITTSLTGKGLPGSAAAAQAAKIAQLQGGTGNPAAIPQFIRADFAAATRDVLYGMCIIMAVAALVALRGLRRGIQVDTVQTAEEFGTQLPGEGRGADLDPGLGGGPGRIR